MLIQMSQKILMRREMYMDIRNETETLKNAGS